MTQPYSKKVIDLFQCPKHMGEIKKPDGKGKVGNPVCGDVMELTLKVGKNKKGEEIIEDVMVKTFGCVAAIASSDVLCDIAKGKTLEKAMKITKRDVLKKLGKIPSQKVHCSLLAEDCLKKAIEDYKKKK